MLPFPILTVARHSSSLRRSKPCNHYGVRMTMSKIPRLLVLTTLECKSVGRLSVVRLHWVKHDWVFPVQFLSSIVDLFSFHWQPKETSIFDYSPSALTRSLFLSASIVIPIWTNVVSDSSEHSKWSLVDVFLACDARGYWHWTIDLWKALPEFGVRHRPGKRREIRTFLSVRIEPITRPWLNHRECQFPFVSAHCLLLGDGVWHAYYCSHLWRLLIPTEETRK